MRKFIILLTLLFALFAFINAIDAATHDSAAFPGTQEVQRVKSLG